MTRYFLHTSGIVALIVVTLLGLCSWGFYGHRQINKYAIYTLPPELMAFYKPHLQYVSEHAVDPDKRRYATKYEAQRHYIDLDHWGEYPFDDVPRQFHRTLAEYSDIVAIFPEGDTLTMGYSDRVDTSTRSLWSSQGLLVMEMSVARRDSVFARLIMPQYYEDEWDLTPAINLFNWSQDALPTKLIAVDRFSEYGILPYHLLRYYRRLVRAFEKEDVNLILQLSADMGHYIGDAHVPLHTTENYNGRMTDQVGIHAFWESRIPELMAAEEYDFFVGKAQYVDDPASYFWDIVLASHQLVDSVLIIEKRVRAQTATGERYCYEERLDRVVRTQCESFARAYASEMKGMVERRMRESILAIGSVWFSAWVDAGQPRLDGQIPDLQTYADREEFKPTGKPLGRAHPDE